MKDLNDDSISPHDLAGEFFERMVAVAGFLFEYQPTARLLARMKLNWYYRDRHLFYGVKRR